MVFSKFAFLHSGGGRAEKKEALGERCKHSEERPVTLVRIGAVQFPEQRSYDHWEVRLHLVYSKIHCHSSEKLKDACSLRTQIVFIRSVPLILTAVRTVNLQNKAHVGAGIAAVLDAKVPRELGGSLAPLKILPIKMTTFGHSAHLPYLQEVSR